MRDMAGLTMVRRDIAGQSESSELTYDREQRGNGSSKEPEVATEEEAEPHSHRLEKKTEREGRRSRAGRSEAKHVGSRA